MSARVILLQTVRTFDEIVLPHLRIAAVILLLGLASAPAAWKVFPAYPSADDQEAPDIHGNRIVWHQYVTFQGAADWDIYSVDITDPKNPILAIVSEYTKDQMYPSVFDDIVAWQDNYWDDWDIYIRDISSPDNQEILLTDLLNDQSAPAISGNRVVWQDNSAGDWDITLADITDPDQVRTYALTPYEFDQQNPAVDREWVIWEDNFVWEDNPDGVWNLFGADVIRNNKAVEYLFGGFTEPQQYSAISGHFVVWQQRYQDEWDVYAADISDPDSPNIIAVAIESSNAINPDIDGNLIVWQDDRNGDWDIYGYNLSTRREFPITDIQPNQTVFSDQTAPAISGSTVVWQDNLGGKMNVYFSILSGPEIAECARPPLGDANGDCVVNLEDFAEFSRFWLSCGLEPISACP